VRAAKRKAAERPGKSEKAAGKSRAKAASNRASDIASRPPTVRIYRQGLGDCILIRLPKEDGSDFSIMIDCGVAVATQDAAKMMTSPA
jgi:hypothetical protein